MLGDSSGIGLAVAGYAACFASTIKALAGARSVKPGPITIEDAKRFCAYSNATRGNVQTNVILT